MTRENETRSERSVSAVTAVSATSLAGRGADAVKPAASTAPAAFAPQSPSMLRPPRSAGAVPARAPSTGPAVFGRPVVPISTVITPDGLGCTAGAQIEQVHQVGGAGYEGGVDDTVEEPGRPPPRMTGARAPATRLRP